MPTDEDGLIARFSVLSEIDVSSAFQAFSKEALDLLALYHELVGGVVGRPFFSGGVKFSFGAGRDGQPPSLQHAGEDALRSVMIDFRRLWLQKEPTRFGNVLGLMRKHAVDGAVIVALDELGRDFKDACRDGVMGKIDPSHPDNPEKIIPIRARQVIDDWINGDSFHGDPEARERVRRWSPPAYEFSLIKAVNRVSNVCLALDVPIAAILAETDEAARGAAA